MLSQLQLICFMTMKWSQKDRFGWTVRLIEVKWKILHARTIKHFFNEALEFSENTVVC